MIITVPSINRKTGKIEEKEFILGLEQPSYTTQLRWTLWLKLLASQNLCTSIYRNSIKYVLSLCYGCYQDTIVYPQVYRICTHVTQFTLFSCYSWAKHVFSLTSLHHVQVTCKASRYGETSFIKMSLDRKKNSQKVTNYGSIKDTVW